MEHAWKVYLEMYVSMASWSCIASAPAPPLRWWSWHGMWHSPIPLSAPCPSPPCRPWDGGPRVYGAALSCRCCLCSVAVASVTLAFHLALHRHCLWISTCCTLPCWRILSTWPFTQCLGCGSTMTDKGEKRDLLCAAGTYYTVLMLYSTFCHWNMPFFSGNLLLSYNCRATATEHIHALCGCVKKIFQWIKPNILTTLVGMH